MGLSGKYRLSKSFIITIWLEILLEFSWKWVLYQQKAIFCWPVHCLQGIYYGNKISNSSPKITGSTNAYLSRWYLDCNRVRRALKVACLGYRSSVKGKHKNMVFRSYLTFSAIHSRYTAHPLAKWAKSMSGNYACWDFFFLLPFLSNVMERDLHLFPSPNEMEQKRRRESHSSAAHGAIWTPLCWGMQDQHKQRQPWPRKIKRERSGDKMICFSTEYVSAREVSYAFETLVAFQLLFHKLSSSPLEVLQSCSTAFLVGLSRKLVKRNHDFMAKA